MTRTIPKEGLPQSTAPVFVERTPERKKGRRVSFMLVCGIALSVLLLIAHSYFLLIWTIMANNESHLHFYVIFPYLTWLVSPILHIAALLVFRKWATRSAICLTIVSIWLLVFGFVAAAGFEIPAVAVIYMFGSGLTLAIAYSIYVDQDT